MSDLKKQPGFCYEIFKNQAFWSVKDTVGYSPCCFYDGYIDTGVTPDQAWQSPGHLELIKKVTDGELIPGCVKCYKQEKNKLPSRRQASKDLYENHLNNDDVSKIDAPMAIDYSVGNLCNLKCTICSPTSSNKWISDWSKLYPTQNMDLFSYRKGQYITIEDLEYLKNIRFIHFHGGGDPLLSDEHIKLIQKVEKVKGLHDVRISYNVNATNRVTPEVLDLWSRCNLVELYFSIDDIGERFEYQRTGAKWQKAIDTMYWFRDNMPVNHMFNINCVWGYLNLYYLDELYYWHQKNFSTNRLNDPVKLLFQKCLREYSLDHINENAIQVLKRKFDNIPEILSLVNTLEVNNDDHNTFWNIVKRTDSIRETNFEKLCPEWAALLDV